MQFDVVHRIAGRTRLRVPGLRTVEGTAEWVEKTLNEQPGILTIRLNIWCESVLIETEPDRPDVSESVLELLGRTESVSRAEQTTGHKKRSAVVRFISAPFGFLRSPHPMAVSSAALLLCVVDAPVAAAISVPLVAATALVPLRRAWRVLWSERRLNVDFLDSLAMVISVVRGQFFTAALIAWMISLGDYIRDLTAARSRKSVRKLLDFQQAMAWLITEDGTVSRVPSLEVEVGREVVIYPGEMIPVDGIILRGQATIDERSLTGESLPVLKTVGQDVFASTVVREGRFVLQATRVGDRTIAAEMVHLVDTAPVGETRVQNHAERLGDKLVSPALLLSGGLFAITGNVDRLLSMLIIDFGTGIRVAAPTAVLASMSRAAAKGVVIKSGRHMEHLGGLHTVVFDKTGTLTHGRPEVGEIVSLEPKKFPARKILKLAAAAEARLKHPVADAIQSRAKAEGIAVPPRSNADFQVGLGVEASINGYHVHLGNEKWLASAGISVNGHQAQVSKLNRDGWSALMFAVNGEVKGFIPYADSVREESADVIRALRERGVRRIAMITGDNHVVARAVAERVGVHEVYSDVLPADKAKIIQRMQGEGGPVAMIGDGINDTPALAYADVGVSLKHGADVARETADVVLMEDSLWKLVSAVEISQSALRTIRQNYTIIAAMNALAMALAIPAGVVSPIASTVLSNGSAILASLNSIRPLLTNEL